MAKDRIHFVGVGGTGMSALAQIHALSGAEVTGSDRLNDHAGLGQARARLEAAGVRFFPQDGSGVTPETTRVIVSTAIEADNQDIARAQSLKRPIVHRADELAALAESRRTVAVAGTSGKSTVTAMVFEILEAAGLSPSLVAGANLPSLRAKGLLGNAWLGRSDLLVIEADESDGTLTRYKPALGLLLNISKDHKELSDLHGLFRQFRDNCRRFVVSADAPGLEEYRTGGATYGFSAGALRGEGLALSPKGSRFVVRGAQFQLNVPGRHNADNALAAAAACAELAVPLPTAAAALARFSGVGRRFEVLGSARGVEVVDDFAHNPDKVRATLSAARLRSRRTLAVFQLHGFAPARFLKAEFLDAFAEGLRPDDVLWLPEIYYAGGTAAKDISAKDYAEALRERGKDARFAPRREAIVEELAREGRDGDVALVLGARDPSLAELALAILERLRR